MKKKFMSIMLAATCLASIPLSSGIAAYAAESSASAVTVKGDANCDGQVDMADIVLIMQALANPNKYGESGTAESHLTAQGKINADMDGDGLTVGDAQTIQKMLLGLDIEKTNNTDVLLGYDDINSEKPLPSATILVKCKSFCPKGEVLKVDAAMGDIVLNSLNYDTAGVYEYDVYTSDGIYDHKLEDNTLKVNGVSGEYQKEYSKDDVKLFDIGSKFENYDLYHHETTEIDFSDYKAGSKGCITFSFYSKHINDLGSGISTDGTKRFMYYYVGEKGTAIGDSIENAEKAYNAAVNGSDTVDPMQPTAQPIGVKSLNDAVITIANYDLKDYDEHYHDSYKQMFASFKNEGYIYHFTEKDDAEKIQLNGMALMPRMSYEDIGIIYNVNYKGKKYQICYYLNDSDYASASFREYFDSRLGFKVAKTIDDMYIILDNGKNDISAFFSIDSSHYCKVRTFDTEADLTGLLNVLDCEKVSLEKDITPSEPTTIGFNSYEEYTKYIEENDLANKIVTYDQLTQYGKFVQFSINSHWMYDNTFSLFYIFNDGSGKTYDLIINDRPHYSEDYLAYPKLTDVQINKSDMRNADTDADNAYYEFDDKLYIYTKGKLSQIKWFDDKHVYILTGNPLLADYPNVDNTYMAKLLDISSANIDNSEYLIGGAESTAASTTQKLVLNCNSFCAKGEVLKVDMAMGDILSRQKYSDYDSEGYPNSGHHEYSITATENYKKIDDERLLINGETSEYTNEFTKEDMKALDISPNIGCYDLYHHETAEIDFSNYETGSTGCVTFRFGWKADGENTLNATSDFTGMEQTIYFYVGEDGVGISNNGWEAAQIAYEAKSDDDIMFYDSIYAKWNGKEVMSNLYEKLRKPSDEVLAINFRLSMSPDYNFVYKGKKLSEYANANYGEYMEKLRDLMGYGPTLKYGEMVYTTGTPNGMKWTQEWYEDRMEYFGEELLSKYIVDGEFLEEELRLDINELMKENRIANDEAEKAYYKYIANEAVKQLDKQNIRYEYMNDPKRLVIYVTADEFNALSLDNTARYGLDISVANGLGVDAIT
ncbi:dockerin type I repeat-containing protein [Ruminococcus flavefaciens]|uniref:dockerin type I repeat-containing protein n=1 Tax=Ruminococcus flavefaciens TaxID=1265 RepID=UPI0004907BB7|nr:dockerin type I repeat-containing protein [Ruminococcus flavefaciens]